MSEFPKIPLTDANIKVMIDGLQNDIYLQHLTPWEDDLLQEFIQAEEEELAALCIHWRQMLYEIFLNVGKRVEAARDFEVETGYGRVVMPGDDG